MPELSRSPQAAVVAAHLEALRARDLSALRETVSAHLAEQLDDPAFAMRLEILGSLVPDDYTVSELREDGDEASLELETDRQTGHVRLVREDGAWKVAGQEWRAKEGQPLPS